MTKAQKIILSFLIFIDCLTVVNCFAQQRRNEIKPDQYRAIHWTSADELPNDGGNVMIKDAMGFLWIGSENGELCRFDGAIFKRYSPDEHKRWDINSTSIHALVEDSLQNIWIGTSKGLSRYDNRADTFTNFLGPVDSTLSHPSIIPFWSTKDEVFCLGLDLEITSYNVHSFTRKKISQLSKIDSVNNGVGVSNAIFDSESNSIWMLPMGKVGLVQISLATGRIAQHNYTVFKKSRGAIGHLGAEAMCYDKKRNCIWINSHEGLIQFTLNDQQFHYTEAFSPFAQLKDYDCYVGIDIDKYGHIWLATMPRGILIYDPETKQVSQLFSDPLLQQKAGEHIFHLYCDRDGIAWASNYMGYGLYEFAPKNLFVKRYAENPNKKDSLSSSRIYTILPGPQGKLWIGTVNGLNIFDPVTETFETLREKDLPGFKGNAIIPVYIDTIRQKAWINAGNEEALRQCCAMRMYEMDLKTRQCRPIVFQVASRPIDTFIVAHALTRPYKGGIIFCDEEHGVFEIKEGSLIPNLIISLKPGGGGFGEFILAEDRYMFLQHGGTLPNFTFENKNGKWTQIPHLLDSLNWLTMFYNKMDQTYWVSFKNELIHYNKEFRDIKTYSRADGYKGFNLKMMIDNDGNLWFVNLAKQLGRLNPVSGIFTIIPETDGYHKQDYDWLAPIAKDIRGDLYFGIGWNERIAEPGWGLDRVYPQRYSAINTTNVYLRSVIINQKSFPLSIGIISLEELSLRYNQNTIRIETGVIDFYSKGKNQLRYKLEENGKKQEWQYTTDYTIRYEGLHPGSYRLVMQASNAGNEFNGPEKILTININPPFWETWWFRILSVIAMIIVVYAIVQERSRNLKKQNKQLEEKVMARTKELKHSLEDLRATQSQLIQSEKMASLGELTAGIAHEIQNPLNFVNNFSEVNRELIDEMEQEMDKGNLADAKAIAKDIKDNEEKINHHGKRADAIVKGMLQHSQTSTGKKELTDINKLADEYLRLAYHGLRAKDKSFNAILKTDYDESVGNISIIPQDIGRVLLNLYNNAFYATNEKNKQHIESYEPTVSVSTKKINDKIEIRVKDNGNGIPKKIVDKIFQPFFTTKPTGQGTGLGLSLSYDIIKAHGGEIKVESNEGEGSEFIIQLPHV